MKQTHIQLFHSSMTEAVWIWRGVLEGAKFEREIRTPVSEDDDGCQSQSHSDQKYELRASQCQSSTNQSPHRRQPRNPSGELCV